VMSCLRDNKDSLMAVLEAFVHDPLITWRLVEVGGAEGAEKLVGDSGEADSSSTNPTPGLSKPMSRPRPVPGVGLGAHSLQSKKLAAGYGLSSLLVSLHSFLLHCPPCTLPALSRASRACHVSATYSSLLKALLTLLKIFTGGSPLGTKTGQVHKQGGHA
jgi:hypothetical protein